MSLRCRSLLCVEARAIAPKLCRSPDSFRVGCRQVEGDAGHRVGLTTADGALRGHGLGQRTRAMGALWLDRRVDLRHTQRREIK